MRTIGAALAEAGRRLSSLPTARPDAEELVGRLLGLSRTELLLRRDAPLAVGAAERLEGWLRRRLAGEPVQYVTGRAAFRGLDLAVGPAVLIPRPETEGLVEHVLARLRAEPAWRQPRVLDLGTGSGAIALAIAAELPPAVVTATDASPDALDVARGNAEALGLEGRVSFLAGDWFDAIGGDERFEAIVSNPPYLATGEWDALPGDVRAHEPAGALFSGPTGLDDLRAIVDEAPRHLVAGGWLALELAEMRAEEVGAWFEGARDWESVRIEDDLAGRPRVLLARRERGPAIAPVQWPEER